MQPLSSSDLDVNALVAALEAEAAYERIWLPAEPWWAALVANKESFASAVHRKLMRGARWPQSDTVYVRKPGHGIRPVSLMSPDVRIAYRAIVSALISPSERSDRSAESYADFVIAPIRAAYDGRVNFWRIGDAKYSHIVVSDVAAYYQYIDHAILRDELDLLGADLALVDGLLGLLDDIGGRSFGIPQRSAPSDWMSDIYASRIERWVIRDGFDVWRYSDDFRIGCTSYAEALRAIESLSRAARDVGLVLNDEKTATPSFITYLAHNADVEVNDMSAQIDPSDVEAAVSSDYSPDDDDQAVEEATWTIERLWDPEDHDISLTDDQWDLRNLSAEQHRAVRRALNTLTRYNDPSALPKLLSILTFQPALTHRVVRYAESVSAESASSVEDFFDKVLGRLSLNEWQRAWVAYGLRACGLAADGDSRPTVWLRAQLANRCDSIAAAEAAVALADGNLVDFRTIEGCLRTTSDDLVPWFLHAIALLRNAGSVPASSIGALKGSTALAAAIL